MIMRLKRMDFSDVHGRELYAKNFYVKRIVQKDYIG